MLRTAFNWCITKQYRPIEVMFLVVAGIMINQGQLLLGGIIIILYLIIEGFIQLTFDKQARDKPWKALADMDRMVDAIKTHRQIYGSTLKEAHDVVRNYKER